MRNILIGFMILTSFSAFAEELVSKKACEGIDKENNRVNITISARMNDGQPVMSYAGPLFYVEIKIQDEFFLTSHVAHQTSNTYEDRYSDGSGTFVISSSSFDGPSNSRLFLQLYGGDGRPVLPFYNTLKLTCTEF